MPAEWARLGNLENLNVRSNCAICGGTPPFPQGPYGSLTIQARNSALGYPCSASLCQRFPLGFVGQAIIIVSIGVRPQHSSNHCLMRLGAVIWNEHTHGIAVRRLFWCSCACAVGGICSGATARGVTVRWVRSQHCIASKSSIMWRQLF